MKKQFLIIGGHSDIGQSVIQQMAQHGHDGIIISREKLNGDAHGFRSHQFNILEDELPSDILPDKLDGLIYLPGSITLKPFNRLAQDDFLNDYQINVLGAVKVLQWAIKPLKRTNQSSVVLLSSVAVRQGLPFHASIASAKGAVEGLVRSLAAEYAPKIRVNAIAPSLTETKLSQKLIASESKREASVNRHPLKRLGLPEDIADMACFLLSEKSSWMTGQVLSVDGGLSSLRA